MKMTVHTLMFFWCLCSVFGLQSSVELTAEFNTAFVNGHVLFLPGTRGATVVNQTMLSGKHYLSIHEFPVKYEGKMNETCSNIGEVLFDHPIPNNVSLTGQKSIFGRSLAVNDDQGNIIACATIKSRASSTKTLVGIFQAASPGIAGTIVLRQASDDPLSATAVEVNLMLVDARSEAMTGLSLAVYKTESTSKNLCEGEIYNPRGKTSCDKRKQQTCPIGDLSAKLGQITVPLPGGPGQRSFYIDTNLPLSGENSVAGHSLVILSGGKPLICTKIQEYHEMLANVTLEGLTGTVEFTQESVYEPLVVNTTLSGYERISVHEFVLDDSSCSIDKMGDLLFNFTKSGVMDELSLYGPNSIMFRSLTVTMSSGKLHCGKIHAKNATFHLEGRVEFNGTTSDALSGFINIEQVAFDTSKAFAYSASILMSVYYKNNLTKSTLGHNWHVHVFDVGNDKDLVVGKRCMSTEGHYNPYEVYGPPENKYESTCNRKNPFRCELGDLSSKLGTYDVGGGLRLFTETENYLASWRNIIGRSVVIHTARKGAPRLACANILPWNTRYYTRETLRVRNISKTRDSEYFQMVVSKALGVSSWRVADVKYEQTNNDFECFTFKFLLIDNVSSNLHKDFVHLIQENPSKLKEFSPACTGDGEDWKINEGNSSEILGVVFGLVFLIILVACIFIWLRKRRQEHEDSSKLVQTVDAEEARNNENIERSDDSEMEAKKEWKLTTSL